MPSASGAAGETSLEEPEADEDRQGNAADDEPDVERPRHALAPLDAECRESDGDGDEPGPDPEARVERRRSGTGRIGRTSRGAPCRVALRACPGRGRNGRPAL